MYAPITRLPPAAKDCTRGRYRRVQVRARTTCGLSEVPRDGVVPE